MEFEDEDESKASDPLLRVVALAVQWAGRTGRLPSSSLHQIVEEVGLPAVSYRPALDEIEAAGIEIVLDAPEELEDDEGVRERGWNANGFDVFLKSNWHRVLTPSEELELAQRIEIGRLAERSLEAVPEAPIEVARRWQSEARSGQRARDELIAHNLRLVNKVVHRWKGIRLHAVSHEDLFQHGCMGLAHAIDKFEPRKGFKLSTYATWWIRQAVSRAIDDTGYTVRLPVYARDLLKRALRVEWRLELEGIRPTTELIANELGEPADAVASVLRWRDDTGSLDRTINTDVAMTVGDTVAGDPLISPDEAISSLALREDLEVALAELDDRDQLILNLRFGLDGRRRQTLEEIAQRPDINLTRERVRQLEKKALTRLRSVAGARLLHDHLSSSS